MAFTPLLANGKEGESMEKPHIEVLLNRVQKDDPISKMRRQRIIAEERKEKERAGQDGKES